MRRKDCEGEGVRSRSCEGWDGNEEGELRGPSNTINTSAAAAPRQRRATRSGVHEHFWCWASWCESDFSSYHDHS